MKPDKRYNIILNYIRLNGPVDCLNKDFVDYYLENVEVKCFIQMYGAHKCPQLARDLAKMKKDFRLARKRVGIEGMTGMGFPRWVWSYRMKNS